MASHTRSPSASQKIRLDIQYSNIPRYMRYYYSANNRASDRYALIGTGYVAQALFHLIKASRLRKSNAKKPRRCEAAGSWFHIKHLQN